MFSQLRNAVEQLAQQQAAAISSDPSSVSIGLQSNGQSVGGPSSTNSTNEGRRSLSLTTNQLAESALSNIRRSIKVPRRSSSPNPSQLQERELTRPHRTLEERLRASFTVGEASEKPTPSPSKPQTPVEIDPTLVALPTSPVQEPEAAVPLDGTLDPLGARLSALSHIPLSETTPTTTSFDSGISKTQPEAILSLVKTVSNDSTQGFGVSSGSEAVEKGQQGTILEESTKLDVEQESNALLEDPESIEEKVPCESKQDNEEKDNLLAIEHERGKIVQHAEDIMPQSNSATCDLPTNNVSITDTEKSEHISPQLDQTVAFRPPSPFPAKEKDVDIEKLQERLKLVEQRFSDVSTSFKQLQAEKRAADSLLKELTAVESITDIDDLRGHLVNLKSKEQISMGEIKRLNSTIQQRDQRLQELRDTHRLESSSQSEQIERLRRQLAESETVLQASEEGFTQSKNEVEQLRTELEKAKGVAREEEEKRSKAISLLKTVRGKLVKVEKEREDSLKELLAEKDRAKEEKKKDAQERLRLEAELDRVKSGKDEDVAVIRVQFEKEVASIKEKHEKENAARKGQYELEAITTKATHSKELAAKVSRITALEASIRSLSEEKDSMFDQLQMRQAELESSQSHLDSVEARSGEFQYQLKEAESRIEILTEELTERKAKDADRSSRASTEELARILSETESKYETKISELRQKLRALEKDRQEVEDEWSKNLQERNRELERLRGIVGGKDKEYANSISTKNAMEEQIEALKADNRKLRLQGEAEHNILLGLQKDIQWLNDSEATLKQDKNEIATQLRAVQKQLEEANEREDALKVSNKSFREELRKVQSSAALLERQRNPGIGYWSTSPRHNAFTQSAVELQTTAQTESRSSIDGHAGSGSIRPSTPTNIPVKNDEEVNLEYIRNVIMQFLEHKEMRPNLVRVLSIILHFTPQETRRLIAKV